MQRHLLNQKVSSFIILNKNFSSMYLFGNYLSWSSHAKYLHNASALIISDKKIKNLTKKSKKESEINNLRPEKKARMIETQVEKSKIFVDEKKSNGKISIDHKNYLTEYEDKKHEFSFSKLIFEMYLN